jgi:hypothetical protein
MTIALALPEPLLEPGSPYYFVVLDEVGYCLSDGPLLLGGDEDAFAIARHILRGAMLVAVYRDGRKIATLTKLC